jgi:hypothetical protein
MARSAGLHVTERPGHEIWICERDEASDPARDLRTMELLAATRSGR